MFLSLDDYPQKIKAEILDVLLRGDDTIRTRIEQAAQSEMASYLTARYDTDALFAKEGADRDPILVLMLLNVVIYYLHDSLPGRKVPETIWIKYDKALAWLIDIKELKINPKGWPLLDQEAKGAAYIAHGGNTPRNNYF